MWDRLGDNKKIYQETAAKYFNIALEACWRSEKLGGYYLSVLELIAALDSSVQEGFLEGGTRLDMDAMKSKCQLAIDHIQTKCGGILECTLLDSEYIPAEPGPYDALVQFLFLEVNFIHRCAKDFLLDTEEGSQILAHDQSIKHDRLINLLRADLVTCQMFKIVNKKTLKPPFSIGRFLTWIAGLRDAFPAARTNELLSTTQRIYNNCAIPYFHCANVPLSLCQKKPDFHLILAQRQFLDVLPPMLEELRDSLDVKSIRHVLLCRLRDDSLQQEHMEQKLAVDWLLEHGVDPNMRGFSPVDLSLNISRQDNGFYTLTHIAPHSQIMGLVLQLYENNFNQRSTVLRLINSLLDRGASIKDDSTVFYVGDLTEYHLGLNIGWPIWRCNKGRLIYKAELSFLLRLALQSIDSAPEGERKYGEWPPSELTQALLARIGQGNGLAPPEVLGYTFCTSQENLEKFDICKIKGVEDSALVNSLLLDMLWEMPRHIYYHSRHKRLWNALYNIRGGIDIAPMIDLRTSLVEARVLVSLEEYWNEVTSFCLTN
jgi:hypothetical protein